MRFERVRVLSVSPVALLRAGDEDKFVSLRQKYPNEARRGGEGVVQRRGMKKTIHSTRCLKGSLGQGKGRRRALKLGRALASNERYLLVPTALFQISRNRDLFQSVARTQNSQGRGIPSTSPPQHNDWTTKEEEED